MARKAIVTKILKLYVEDQDVIAWINKQDNFTLSVKQLIRHAVKKKGLADYIRSED